MLRVILISIFLMRLTSSLITYILPEGSYILNLLSGFGIGFFYIGPKVNEHLNKE